MVGVWNILGFLLLNGVLSSAENAPSANASATRQDKQLSVFTVVKFPNSVCASSTTGRNGTCYTSSECSSKSGSSSGTCASGFGVCCVFEKSCGSGSIAENCTYFTNSAMAAGSACSITVCKSSSEVCQLRLDFEAFQLTNPETSTLKTIPPSGTRIGTCITDTFTVTVPGANAPPVLCGLNTGYHIYVEAADQCNVLSAYFGSATTSSTSSLAIKVTHVKCNSKLKAPEGCLQYFTEATGTIQSFNFNSGSAGGGHLANQDYCSCVRSERTACSICYWVADTDFGVSNSISSQGLDSYCGIQQFAFAPTSTFGSDYDYLQIPFGTCSATSLPAAFPASISQHDRYCGSGLRCGGLITTTAAIAVANTNAPTQTICTNNKPFKICFYSNHLESEALPAGNIGFNLGYFMRTACNYKN